jgi:serine/threonine-protein kinase
MMEKLKPHHAVNITLQVLEILKSLHNAKTLHKNINSKSVFLFRKSTRRIEVDLIYLGLVGSGAQLNDPGYLSPEQVADMAHSDRKDDLWAASVLLYEMVFGALPFEGKSAEETMGKILLEEVSLPPDLLEGYPALHELIARALTKRSDERYQDAMSMMADLSACFRQAHTLVPTGSSFPPADAYDAGAEGQPIDLIHQQMRGTKPEKRDTPPPLAPKTPESRPRTDDSDLTQPSFETGLIAEKERQHAEDRRRVRETDQFVQTIRLEPDERQNAKKQSIRVKLPRKNKGSS